MRLARFFVDRSRVLQEWSDIVHFSKDFSFYVQEKMVRWGRYFEKWKGRLVDILMVKRGRYQGSFLNVSLFLLIAAGVLAAPHISSYYPTLGAEETLLNVTPPSASVADLNFDEMSMTTQISDKPPDKVRDYKVKSGDTLSTIAGQFSITADTIKWANNLEGDNPVLKPDQILKIPPVTGVVHTVKAGETINSIAKKYQVDAQNIANYPFNDFVDLDTFALSVGQTIIVPEGIMPEAAKPAVTRPPAPQYLALQSQGKLLFPTSGTITQQPVWYHMALDIANRSMPDVYAAESGTVVLSTCLTWGYGCHLIVEHPGGFQTLYGHLTKYYVYAGDKVTRGQAIGRMGSTGRSTGIHLHFEVRIGGHPINPWTYLR